MYDEGLSSAPSGCADVSARAGADGGGGGGEESSSIERTGCLLGAGPGLLGAALGGGGGGGGGAAFGEADGRGGGKDGGLGAV